MEKVIENIPFLAKIQYLLDESLLDNSYYIDKESHEVISKDETNEKDMDEGYYLKTLTFEEAIDAIPEILFKLTGVKYNLTFSIDFDEEKKIYSFIAEHYYKGRLGDYSFVGDTKLEAVEKILKYLSYEFPKI